MKRSRNDLEGEDDGATVNREVSVKDEPLIKKEENGVTIQRQKCPYLDTINRPYLDFDFEKVCSISLTNLNVYSCLVCGKFFQGRGRNTHAHIHSVQAMHHVLMNLHNGKIYCLPDNYEVIDSSLDDIRRALFPTFNKVDIAKLDRNTTLVRDVHGVTYLPGFVGLNNLKHTDYVNVVVQALAHVTPIRDYFLQPELFPESATALVHRFGEVIRKLWSRHNFKSTVSPHDLLQEIVGASKKRFVIGKPAECLEFLAWLLNTLHMGLLTKKNKRSSVIFEAFQGQVKVRTLTKKKRSLLAQDDDEGNGGEKKKEEEEDNDYGTGVDKEGEDEDNGKAPEWTEDVVRTNFLYLTIDIPPVPLFKDSMGGIIIPQIPLYTVLEKFGGEKVTDVVKSGTHMRKQFWITKLPRYLILSLARFSKNFYFVEKNPTIVNFPVKNLELKDYYFPEVPIPSAEEVQAMSIADLTAFVTAHGASPKGVVEKSELVERAMRVATDLGTTKYDLVANIVHDSPPGQDKKEAQRSDVPPGSYRVHVFNRASDQWYEIQDLHVQETLPQLIGISEACILIYERKTQPVSS